MAINSQGVEVYWSTSTAASTSSGALVGEVTDFSGPGGQASVIDITHLASTAREKLIGIRDEGQMSIGCNFVPGNTAQIALRADRASRTLRKAVIKLNDPSSYYAIFDAYCSGFSISGGVNAKVSANVVLEIANAVTYTTTMS